MPDNYGWEASPWPAGVISKQTVGGMFRVTAPNKCGLEIIFKGGGGGAADS
jgi:hypothetical protein